MPYARIALYTADPDAMEEVLRKAEAELVPMNRQQPGFRSYSAFRTGADSVISITGWEAEEQANQANERLAGWVRREFGSSLRSVEAHVGEVTLFNGAQGGPGYGRIAVWRFKPAAVEQLVKDVETEFVPLVARQPGFVRYAVCRTGAASSVSVAVYASRAAADAAATQIAPWVEQHTTGAVESVQRHEGEMLWSVWGAQD
ncbi:MAG: antibiotic biosynthesis monooxygenase [Thermomicrobiales bacterium]